MSRLFEKTVINGMELPNRFVRSATWEGLASPEGEATPVLVERMAALAGGGVGLIISSHAYVSPEGQATPWQLGIYDEKHIPGLRQLATAVHDNDGKILLQLAHAGVYAAADLTGRPALAVSPPAGDDKKKTRVITAEEIDRLVLSFARAAQRAQQAGFDGVQLHSGHGYLLSQFLSPYYNRRKDE
ncbi:MAG: NADH:flavin oxidoreductase, partial [Desulfosudaceae bacterium]